VSGDLWPKTSVVMGYAYLLNANLRAL